ncbi:MAG: GDP-mannose 4,6-dehydratase [Pyrinomonadaceae bacterium]
MPKLFVTGGAGFIGSAFIRLVLAEIAECNVVNFDALTYAGNLDNLAGFDETRHRFVRGDIADRATVREALTESTDAVINFAAESHVDRSIASADEFLRTNIIGTQVLLDAAREKGVRRFVQVSCYDEQTKALTKAGLKRYSEIQKGDIVLSLNPQTGAVEEKRVLKIIVQDYEGEMIHFKNALVDMKVTPNHRMLFTQKGRNGLGPTRIEEAQNILDKNFLYYPKGAWQVAGADSIEIEGVGRVPAKELFYIAGVFIGDGFTATQSKKLPSLTGLSKRESDEARRSALTGRFEKCAIRVGTKTHVTSTSWRIFFDVPERDKARQRLERSLTSLGIEWRAYKNKSGEHIYFSSKEWTVFFQQFGKGFRYKHIPDWMLAFGREALAALFDGLIDSDGHFNKSGSPIFSTSSPRLVENICELGIKLGLSPRITQRDASAVSWFGEEDRLIRASTDAYLVHFRRGNIGVGQQNYVREKYRGKIWCVKVEDNKNLIVERNGLLQFCGNTDEVMGSLPEDEGALFREDSPFAPNSPYAASKASAEHLVRAAHHTFGLDTVITRCGNNYGPRQFPEKFLPLMLSNAMNDEPIPVYGDGRNVRDWIYVEDHCRAILRVMEAGRTGESYNIGARNERRNIEVAESVLRALGKPLSLIRHVKDRLGHDRRYAIDPTKIETELDWRPLETWESGLEKTIRWYAENGEWIRRARSGDYRDYYARQYGGEVDPR